MNILNGIPLHLMCSGISILVPTYNIYFLIRLNALSLVEILLVVTQQIIGKILYLHSIIVPLNHSTLILFESFCVKMEQRCTINMIFRSQKSF